MLLFGSLCIMIHAADWLCRLVGLDPVKMARFFRCPGSRSAREIEND